MKRPPPPLLAVVAAVAQSVLTPKPHHAGALRTVVAGATAVASGVLATAAARDFRRRGTTLEPFDPSRATVLVTTGANAVSRNPMYTGLAGMLVANAVRLGSWRALVPLATYAVVVDRFQIAAEEAALRTTFGSEYDAYLATVPRWLGPPSARLVTTAVHPPAHQEPR